MSARPPTSPGPATGGSRLGDDREWFASAFYLDTDRAETEIGREFEVEDDDGELETDSVQANQLDAFAERNYGVVHRLRASVRLGPRVGDRAHLRPDGLRLASRRIGKTTSTSTSTSRHERCGRTSCRSSTSPTTRSFDFFRAVPHQADDLREDEFLASVEAPEADDSELMLKTSARLRPRRIAPQGRASRATTASGTSPSAHSRTRTACWRRTRTCYPLFDAKDKRANGFVKWTYDFSTATTSSSAPVASSRASTSTRPFQSPGRGRRRACRRSASSSPTATRSWSPRIRSSSIRARTCAGTWATAQAAPVRRAHRAPAELRPAEPDARHRRRGEHPRQPDPRPGDGPGRRRRLRRRTRRQRRDRRRRIPSTATSPTRSS